MHYREQQQSDNIHVMFYFEPYEYFCLPPSKDDSANCRVALKTTNDHFPMRKRRELPKIREGVIASLREGDS